MRRHHTLTAAVLAVALLVPALGRVGAEERIDHDVYWRIRQEATTNSQVMATVQVLTDQYGPRLTGSPNLKAAAEWATGRMTEWGLRNGRLEPWDFGRPGWLNERLSAHIVRPVKDHLVAEALAWTPGTNGPVRAPAVSISLPDRPTQPELDAYLESLRARIAGTVVLVGQPQQVLVAFNPPALRRDDRELMTQYDPARVGVAPPPTGAGTRAAAAARDALGPMEIDRQLSAFLVAAGARVRVNDAGRDHGQIRAFSNRTYDVTMAPPTVVLRNEDYGRIWRLLAGGDDVDLEFDIVNRDFPEGRTSYNAVAEIPGTDRADEVVMLGGHLDSWHAATGATDNAVGCAVMMEAVRILAAIGVTPRRTIRLALWSGEEQGLLGSQAYVKEHFGSFEEPTPEFAKLVAYFNLDTGTGRARGMTVFGPPSAAAVLREAIAPFQDLGVLGAMSTDSRRRGGSDHTSFNEAGLPGISIQQDPIQYGSHTWHTNLDTYERIVEDDVRQSAIVVASAVYHLAMRDEPLPRFTQESMPKRPGTTRPETSRPARSR